MLLNDLRKSIKAVSQGNLVSLIEMESLSEFIKTSLPNKILGVLNTIYAKVSDKQDQLGDHFPRWGDKLKYTAAISKLNIFQDNHPLSLKIKDELTNLTDDYNVNNFMRRITKDANTQEKYYQEICYNLQASILEHLKEKQITRKILDNVFIYENIAESMQEDELFTELIALGRLMTKSIIREYKNAQDNPSLLGESVITDSTRIITFPTFNENEKIKLVEEQKLFQSTGARSDKVKIKTHDKSTKYLSIALTIEKVKDNLKITDHDIALLIRKTLKNNDTEIHNKLNQINPQHQAELAQFISTLTYLLFGTEAVRNPASLIIHQMMLDLIIKEKMSFLDAFTHQSFEENTTSKIPKYYSGGLMPMSHAKDKEALVGVVDIVRLIHSKFKTTFTYAYDQKTIKSVTNTSLVEKIISLEADMMLKWLSKCQHESSSQLSSGISYKKCFNAVLDACKEWFGENCLNKLKSFDNNTTGKTSSYEIGDHTTIDNLIYNKYDNPKEFYANFDLNIADINKKVEHFNNTCSASINKLIPKQIDIAPTDEAEKQELKKYLGEINNNLKTVKMKLKEIKEKNKQSFKSIEELEDWATSLKIMMLSLTQERQVAQLESQEKSLEQQKNIQALSHSLDNLKLQRDKTQLENESEFEKSWNASVLEIQLENIIEYLNYKLGQGVGNRQVVEEESFSGTELHFTGDRLSQEDLLPAHALLSKDSITLAGESSY